MTSPCLFQPDHSLTAETMYFIMIEKQGAQDAEHFVNYGNLLFTVYLRVIGVLILQFTVHKTLK